ncbi:hypothetical protein ANO11243_093480 [Dothideomycetidae sp. 11243]|nr:hypothetical protein ANO11243_093480 [fungal sp. No.11243]
MAKIFLLALLGSASLLAHGYEEKHWNFRNIDKTLLPQKCYKGVRDDKGAAPYVRYGACVLENGPPAECDPNHRRARLPTDSLGDQLSQSFGDQLSDYRASESDHFSSAFIV